jgi:hypothetical protein
VTATRVVSAPVGPLRVKVYRNYALRFVFVLTWWYWFNCALAACTSSMLFVPTATLSAICLLVIAVFIFRNFVQILRILSVMVDSNNTEANSELAKLGMFTALLVLVSSLSIVFHRSYPLMAIPFCVQINLFQLLSSSHCQPPCVVHP